jgi:hypothetical protein
MQKQKKLIDVDIFHKTKDDQFTWKDLKDIDFQDDDVIHVQWEEGYYSENNSYDAHWSATVTRKVLETDEQFAKRIKREEIDATAMRNRRYENYLKLKAEFENSDPMK